MHVRAYATQTATRSVFQRRLRPWQDPGDVWVLALSAGRVARSTGALGAAGRLLLLPLSSLQLLAPFVHRWTSAVGHVASPLLACVVGPPASHSLLAARQPRTRLNHSSSTPVGERPPPGTSPHRAAHHCRERPNRSECGGQSRAKGRRDRRQSQCRLHPPRPNCSSAPRVIVAIFHRAQGTHGSMSSVAAHTRVFRACSSRALRHHHRCDTVDWSLLRAPQRDPDRRLHLSTRVLGADFGRR
jgi:hypothetical protein